MRTNRQLNEFTAHPYKVFIEKAPTKDGDT